MKKNLSRAFLIALLLPVVFGFDQCGSYCKDCTLQQNTLYTVIWTDPNGNAHASIMESNSDGCITVSNCQGSLNATLF